MLMRGGSKKVWSVSIVVAAWVWWYVEVNRPASLWSSVVVEEQQTLELNYTTVRFTTNCATKESYSKFIEDLRDNLADPSHVRHEIRVMREPSTVRPFERYVLVELSNWAPDSPVTLAINVTNAYVVAYRTGNRSFFLRESSRDPNPFPDTERSTLPFSGNYMSLENMAGERREAIDLGMDPLETAIMTLRISKTQQQIKAIARSLIVVIQMVAEAVRFRVIEYRVRRNFGNSFTPDNAMLRLENRWGALSTAVQQSGEGGVFSSPVELRDRDDNPVTVGNTQDLSNALAIMLFICRSSRAPSNDQYFIDHLLMIRPVVVLDVATDVDADVNEKVNGDDDTCEDPEPTVRISGRDGLCVDVRDGQYSNGNPIQLWPCKANLDANQLWTLRKDGTIRSNGNCLTTYGYSPGNYVMIYDCSSAVTAATIWQVWDDGTIINPESQLVLTAESGSRGTTLTLQTNIYASRQAWRADNNTEPFVTLNVGFNDLCMQANGDAMWVVECNYIKAEQKWALYPDGSMRPHQNRDRCLTSTNNQSPGSVLIISSCNAGSEGQRWVFRNDGTILNLNNKLVMDVKGSDPSLQQIIIWPFTGNPNQKWFLDF